jgi:hypothetical protein
MNSAAIQTNFLLTQYDRWLAGLHDGHLALEPVRGTKTAGWIIGHLAITGDFARRLCGLPPIAPKEWRAMFAPGTLPSLESSSYPPMGALLTTFRAVYRDLAANAGSSSAEALSAPNPFEAARPAFPTGRDFVLYLLTGHLAYHLGQLSIWRSAAGLPA